MPSLSSMKELFELSGLAGLALTPDGQILEIFGDRESELTRTLQEQRHQGLSGLLVEGDLGRLLSALREANETGEKQKLLLNLFRTRTTGSADPDLHFTQWTLQRQAESSRTPRLLCCIESLDRSLQEENLLQLAQNFAHVGTWMVDVARGVCLWGPLTYDIHEVPRGTLIRLEDGINYYIPEHRPLIESCVNRAITDGTPWDVELQIQTMTGRRVWVRAKGRAVHRNGHLERLEGVFQDIDDRKQQQLKLQELINQSEGDRSALKMALSVARMGLWRLDLVTGALHWDSAMKELYGAPPEQANFTYEDWSSRVHQEDLPVVEPLVQDAIQGRSEFRARFRVCSHGVTRHIEGAGSILYLNGEAKEFIGLNWDITDQINREQSLEHSRLEAESARRSKETFLANMSHEIRTPLNGIIGVCQLAKDKCEQEEVARHIDLILDSGDVLLSLLNDILDYSRLEAGKFPVVKKLTDLADLFAEVCSLFLPNARQKGLALICKTDIPKSGAYDCDGIKIRQILSNLLGNAIKFTTQGRVRVQANITESDETCRLCFSVEDSGPGISRDAQARLFLPFQQVNSSSARSQGGTGLGLAICRQLVALLGGKISLHSVMGQGARFSVELPIKKAQFPTAFPNQMEVEGADLKEDPISVLSQHDLTPTRILVAEDNPVNQVVMRGALKRLGFLEPDFAINGQQAVEMATQHHYDLILMDCHMPEVDGYEASRTIARELGIRSPPIVAVTASVMKEDIQRCYDAGMIDWISKPLDRAHLARILLMHLPGLSRGRVG